MKRQINQRMAVLAQSEIRAMTQACVQAKGLNMAQGVCDTPVPPVVLRAAAQAMERGKNVYSRFDGLPDCGRRSPRSSGSTTASWLIPKRT